MDPLLYEAAAKGEIEPFKEISNVLGRVVTHNNKNTILHVNIISRDRETIVSTEFVEQILEMCPSLLQSVNAKGDAPLHVAAKCGHASVPKELESGVESTARQMLGMTNDEKNTALHEAMQHRSLDVVKILIKEDPAVPYSTNGCGETPLYMAAERGFEKMLTEILENCPSVAHEGPSGKTALHAAAVNINSIDVVKLLLDKKKSLIGETDRYGWTPLHYASYFDRNIIAELLLNSDKSLAYIVDNDRKMTALHLAAGQGKLRVVEEIISYCPECCELVDGRGWNVLHFAMVSFDASDLKHLLNNYPIVRNLINDKDKKGNTPLHLLAALCRDSFHRIVPWNVGGDYQAVNKQNISVKHITRYGFPQLEQEIRELSKYIGSGQYPEGVVSMRENKIVKRTSHWKFIDENYIGMKEASEFHLVVATLIATVAFSAAFTLPGGNKSEGSPDQGAAILSKQAAFQAFVISDAIAMALSLSAVFVYFILSLKAFQEFIFLFAFALFFTLVAMAAMMVAFVTGAYAMLEPSLGLAIVTCIIGLSFFVLVIFMFYKVLSKADEELEEPWFQ
ncbi:hypothetical protein CICLE_v10006407mg [Citrus x clementina]|uniref:PGG domain-containing protein n=1 Tax=Citrus clementina TaxID=85681 RepID=V4S3I4_CITCL|nr:hypothetical protein CICLE_v10006407mg [Citrus x clementina]